MKKVILGTALAATILLFTGVDLKANGVHGEAHLEMVEVREDEWDCTLTALVEGAGPKDFQITANTRTNRASVAACKTWAKAIIAGVDVDNNIPASNKTWKSTEFCDTNGNIE